MAQYSGVMQVFSRRTWVADVLVLAGFVLLAAALWLWFGVAALLGYIGTALIVVGVLVAIDTQGRRAA